MTIAIPSLIGDRAEALAFEKCQSLGFCVEWPSTKTSRFDLIVNGHKLQVKCRTVARRLIQPHRVYLQKNNKNPYSINDIDAVALLFVGQWYVIPSAALRVRNSFIQNSFDIRLYSCFKDKWSLLESRLRNTESQLSLGFSARLSNGR